MSPIRVFVAYAHADDRLRQQLVKHLSQLRHEKLIQDWYDRKIAPGDVWQEQIDDRLERSDVALLLISADFLASDYCIEHEMKRALELHRAGRMRVVPILLRPVDWAQAAFAHLQALPSNGFPITSRHWKNQDEAFAAVAAGLRDLVTAIATNQDTAAKEPPALMATPGDDKADPSVDGPTASASHAKFVEDVADLYRLFGYRVTVSDREKGILSCDLMLRGSPSVHLLVRCTSRSEERRLPEILFGLQGAAASDKSSTPLTGVVAVLPNTPSLATRSSFTPAGHRVLGYDELFDELLNLANVLDSYREAYEHKDIYLSYLPLTVRPLGLKERKPGMTKPVDEALRQWLEGPEQLLVVFGDFGSGKTTLLERFKYDLASEFRGGGGDLVPLLLPLRHFDSFGPVELFIETRLQTELDVRLPVSRLIPLLQQKRFVFLLDGFDEIAVASDQEKRQFAFAKLFPLLLLAHKTVLTCRPSYFVDDKEFKEALSFLGHFQFMLTRRGTTMMRERYAAFMESTEAWLDLKQVTVPATYQHAVLELNPLSSTDIDRYVATMARGRGIEQDATRLRERIRNTYDLEDLASRPVLLDLIVKTLPTLPEQQEASPATIYETYTGSWLNLDYAKGEVRMLIPAARKMQFMQELAWVMYTTSKIEISYEELAPHVSEFFDPQDAKQAEYLTTDIQSCSFLGRELFSGFRFVHKSYMEFFVAARLRDRFAREGVAAMIGHEISYEVAFFVGDMLHSDRTLMRAYVTAMVAFLNSPGAGASELAASNLLRIFGYSRSECRRLDAAGTTWRSIRAKGVTVSGRLRRQQWTDVTFEKSTLNALTVTNLNGQHALVSNSEMSQVSFRNVWGHPSSYQSPGLELTNVQWHQGSLGGDCNVAAVDGQWNQLLVDQRKGGLRLKGTQLTRCRFQISGGENQLVGLACRRTSFTGLPGGPQTVGERLDAIQRLFSGLLDEAPGKARWERVRFTECVFSWIDFSRVRVKKCVFERCVFIACGWEDQGQLKEIEALHGRGCRFVHLFFNSLQHELTSRERSFAERTYRTASEVLGSMERAGREERRRKLSPEASRGVRTDAWWGFTSNPLVACTRAEGTSNDRLLDEIGVDDVVW